MTNDSMPTGAEKETLRVALDKQAAQNFIQMVARLKIENSYVRIQPSAFVSFLVSYYFAAYFEKDMGVLVAEFFDSKSYHEAQLQLAKNAGNFEEAMSESLETIRRIKAQARRKAVHSRKTRTSPAEGGA